jgi:hypothetical protein
MKLFWCSVLTGISRIFALLACAAVLWSQSTHWWNADIGGVPVEVGFEEFCFRDKCGTEFFRRINLVCSAAVSRPLSDIQSRFTVIRAVQWVSVGAGLVSVSFSLDAHKWLGAPQVLCLIISLAAASTALGLGLQTVSSWLFCGKTFCAYARTDAGFISTTCSENYGPGMILSCLSLFGFGVSVLTLTVAICCDSEAEKSTPTEIIAPIEKSSASGKVAEATRAPTEPEKPAIAMPPGVWSLDQDSGLYWSEEEQLYYNAETEQYYSPSSNMWYDPHRDVWYPAE